MDRRGKHEHEVVAELRFSRYMNSDEKGIIIEFTDKESGIIFCHGIIPLEQFALAITGNSGQTSECFVSTDLLGTMTEHEQRRIFVPKGALQAPFTDKRARQLEAEAVLFDHEDDGWKGDWDDLYNHHRFISKSEEGEIYDVHFTRRISLKDMPRCEECRLRGKHDYRCSQSELIRPRPVPQRKRKVRDAKA